MQDTKNKEIAIVQKIEKPSRAKTEGTYDEFILWYALPHHEKVRMGLETHEQFAEYHHFHRNTLSTWKKRSDFYVRVTELRREWAKDRSGDVIAAMYKSAMSTGPSAALDRKLWMQIFEGFSEKTEVQHTKKVELTTNDLRFLIGLFPDDLKRKYYGYIREIIDAGERLRSTGQLEDRRIDRYELEGSVSDQTDHDASNISIERTDELSKGDKECIRGNMVRITSASDNQGTARWWKEQIAWDHWV